MFNDLFEMCIHYSPDNGAGAGAGNANTNDTEVETLDKSAGQSEIIKIGDEAFDKNDPEFLEKIISKTQNLQKGLTQKAQELSKLKKVAPTTKVDTTKVTTTEPKIDIQQERINKIYDRGLNDDIDDLIKSESERYKSSFGENFDNVKDLFNKEASGLKKFDLSTKEQILKSGNLDLLFNKVFTNSMMTSKEKGNDTDPKKNINSYKDQEQLPPTPNGKGQSNVPGEISIEKQLKGDTKFKRAKEMSIRSRQIRSGEGIR